MSQNVMHHIMGFLSNLGSLSPNNTMNFINLSEYVLRYLAFISYFYTAIRYRSVKDKVESNSGLLNNNTFMMLVYGLNIPDGRIRKQIFISLALLSKYSTNFLDWLLSSIDNNLMPLLQVVGSMSED